MPFLHTHGAELYYETAGRTHHPVLVLLHAGVATLRMWDAQTDALATDHFVVRFDARGYGRTTSDGTPFTNHGDVVALLDHLGVAAATLVGSSRGGMIAVNTAVVHTDRVDGVVTIGSGIEGFPPTTPTDSESALFAGISELTALGDRPQAKRLEVELWVFGPERDAKDLDPAFVARAFELNQPNVERGEEPPNSLPLQPSAYSRLASMTAPALITVGDFDVSRMAIIADVLVEVLPHSEGHRFAKSAHLPSVEEPQEFLRVLREWLGRHSL
ncbi:alpha/beta fold hydrolase [Arthrobacter sp. AZCC_0090]|uniref:alpha/beta fold hydrolase n=1 Tax=Arthrobacter sp. AZCC_0090 TaxID=2735881 RepID=UPI0016093176|nr:alpha/beta hydrolase [Arthrobacter sp. AZCC_0090]MBB6407140.1 pimeloyl-ACP methyl ester carboxylesterase [Arthrobacter sp. AZCC_0090]